MESKKQLIIVPPMSEAFKKLHEVLNEIADSEKIEITKIEEVIVLNQMLASNQSLVIFSNIRNCANCLLENKALIAKFHTRVVLLTPKEIPSKTLVKLTKAGLSEAILDSSPPKTLLHKVKMHLRTVKAPTFDLGETDDQVVSSMINTNRISNAVSDTFAKPRGASFQEESLVKDNPKENSKGPGKSESPKIDLNITPGSPKPKLPAKNARTRGELNVGRERDIYYPSRKKLDVSLRALLEHLKKKRKEREPHSREIPVKKHREMPQREPRAKKDRIIRENSPRSKNARDFTIETLDYSLEDEAGDENATASEYDYDHDQKDSGYSEENDPSTNEKNKSKTIEEIALSIDMDELQGLFDTEEALSPKPDAHDEQYLDEELPIDKKGDDEISPESDDTDFDENEYEIQKGKSAKKAHADESAFVGEENASSFSDELTEAHKNNKDKKAYDDSSDDDLDSETESSQEESDYKDKGTKKHNEVDESNDDEDHKNDDSDENKTEEKKQKHVSLMDSEAVKDEKKSAFSETLSDEEESHFTDQDEAEVSEKNRSGKTQNNESADDISGLNSDEQNNSETNKNAPVKPTRGKPNSFDASSQSKDPKETTHNWDNLVDKDKSDPTSISRNYPQPVDMDFSYLNKEIQEQTIVYHKAARPVRKFTPEEEIFERTPPVEERAPKKIIPEEEIPKLVIEVDARGIEFSIEIVKLIYKEGTKADDYFDAIAKELMTQYKAYPVFYSFSNSTNEHTEVFNSILRYNFSRIPEELKESWKALSENQLKDYFGKSMPVWQCRDIKGPSGEDQLWENTELPSWASIELANKKVEFVVPYFEGVERMGLAIIFFPEGVNASKERSIVITLETARTVFLNSIERNNTKAIKRTKPSTIFDKVKSFFKAVYNFFTDNEQEEE